MEVLLCERVNDLRHSLFYLLNWSHNDSLWALGITKSHREKGLDYRKAEELWWCPSWSNNLWQGWSCGLVHCPAENATDPIWRVLASSQGISCWTPLKPQYSNPNPNRLANHLWSIDFLIPPTPLIIPNRLPAFLKFLMPLKNWCSIPDLKAVWSIPYVSVWFFPGLKHFFYCISFFLTSRLHFWNSPAVTIKVYSNSCCSCSFEAEILKVGQSSRKMYSNKIVNFQESTTILNACTKNVWRLIECTM